MQVIVLATKEQKAQFEENAGDMVWMEDVNAFTLYTPGDVFVDLTFEPTEDRMKSLAALLPKPVIINSVIHTLQDTNPAFVRINGWNTFQLSPFCEAACLDDASRQKAEAALALLGKKVEWLPDTLGFVTARVVSMIINEAYLALEEGVSTKEEINTAMKLGTAYPYGPFDWAEKIGVQNIAQLLEKLSHVHHRYTPARLLVQEAAQLI